MIFDLVGGAVKNNFPHKPAFNLITQTQRLSGVAVNSYTAAPERDIFLILHPPEN